MQPFLAGFSDELTKVAIDPGAALMRQSFVDAEDPTVSEIVHETTKPSPKNYLKTMALGAMLAPLMTLSTKHISRALHNRGVHKALEVARPRSPAAKRLVGELDRGPMFRPVGDYKPGMRPLMTPASLATDMAGGALTGSVVQALRDATANDRR